MKSPKIIDISPVLSPKLAVFPGDTPFSQNTLMDFARGDHLALSSITTTLHAGAHADAPSHYHPKGCDMASRKLHYYLGPCQVIRLKLKAGERIYPEHIKKTKIRAPRILFRTDSFLDPNHWHNHFNSLSPELIEYLAKKKVILVGIDTPSIDPAQSKGLESHQAIYRQDVAVLEGLVLKGVASGTYWLSALPLKIAGAEAAPVRAVLLKNR